MTIFQALVLGVTQGLTEFIPVSSSGHLVIMHHALGTGEHGLVFDVALHLGTLIALLVYFRKDIYVLVRSIFIKSRATRLAWLLVLATIPAVIAGVLLESAAEDTFRSLGLVCVNLLVVGVVMLVAERYWRRQDSHAKLAGITRNQALAMGVAQAAAVVPGVSRSGITIATGLFAGLDRVAATRFSFLLGIPITAGAILKVFVSEQIFSQMNGQTTQFITGIVSAAVFGLLAIHFLLRYLGRHGLHVFAYYRLGLAAVILAALAIR